MRALANRKNTYAVSEVISGLLLVLIAVITFTAIYVSLIPSGPEQSNTFEIKAHVTDQGSAVLTHIGGGEITNYKVCVNFPNGSSVNSDIIKEPWKIGEDICPLELINVTNYYLIDETTTLEVEVFIVNEGHGTLIFNGDLTGKIRKSPSIPPEDLPMLITSLQSNSPDEDLICFNYTIEPAINAKTYVYNWKVNSNPIYHLLMAFDTITFGNIKDYSGNGNNGTLHDATWISDAVVGGGMEFDGLGDYITIPYCFENDYIYDITLETWINTTSNNCCLASYGEDKYFEIRIYEGKILLITTADGNTVSLLGEKIINDNQWHHIAVKYDHDSGIGTIIIDGNFDKSETIHNLGDLLGDGTRPNGNIGLGSTSSELETIFSTSFETIEEENKWSENTGRTSAYYWEWYNFDRYASDILTPRTGTYSIGGNGNFDPRYAAFDREPIDISEYSNVKVSLYYSYKYTESSDDVCFYYKDGSNWEPIFEEHDPEIVYGEQADWTYVEADIPDNIDDLYLEFAWSTSEWREYVAIDDLKISGYTETGIDNYTGKIDEFKIYNRALSDEQIYQNYLCTKDGQTDKYVIVSEETILGETWSCIVTPNDSNEDDNFVESNSITLLNYIGGSG